MERLALLLKMASVSTSPAKRWESEFFGILVQPGVAVLLWILKGSYGTCSQTWVVVVVGEKMEENRS